MHRHRLAARQRQADDPQPEADQVAAAPPAVKVAAPAPARRAAGRQTPAKKVKAKGRR